MRVEDFLRILKEEQAAIAHDTVTASNADPFIYGRAVGMHAGLERAMALILGKHDEQERRTNEL